VAEAVLTDRSTGRLSSGQRTAMMDVERVAFDDGRPAPTGRAWTYEYLSQGSPTVAERGRETYRHAIAVSAARYGDDNNGAPLHLERQLHLPRAPLARARGPLPRGGRVVRADGAHVAVRAAGPRPVALLLKI